MRTGRDASSTRASSTKSGASSVYVTPEEIESSFPKRVQTLRVHPLYRLGLAGVLGSLVMLQLIYVAMVAAAAALTVWYCTLLPGIVMDMHINFITIVLVSAPVVMGSVGTLFLFKPFLNRSSRPQSLLELRREDEPALFQFVEALCRSIGAPVPKAIVVDLQANASASFRHGWSDLLTRRLTLTIGLPLVQALTLTQFAGVLGHEFGHFSQAAGMRLHFMIARIQIWFARVAYERDSLDAWLDRMCEESGWRLKFVFTLASGVVHLSRLVLIGLLNLGNLAGSWFSRQMEFDADQYEAMLAGSANFAKTMYELPALSAGVSAAWRDVNDSWKLRMLPNDFPALAGFHRTLVTPEQFDKMNAEAEEAQQDKRSTHPSPQERVARVEQAGWSGLFHLDGPATRLFRDFESLSSAATQHQYQQDIDEDYRPDFLIPSSDLVGQTSKHAQAVAGSRELLGELKHVWQWLDLPEGSTLGPREISDAEYWKARDTYFTHAAAHALVMLDVKIDAPSFQIADGSLAGVEQALHDSQAEVGRVAAELSNQAGWLRQRLLAVAETEEAKPWLAEYKALTAQREAVFELTDQVVRMGKLQMHLNALPGARTANTFDRHRARIRELVEQIRAGLPKELAARVVPPAAGEIQADVLASRVIEFMNKAGDLAVAHLCALAAKGT